MSGMGVFQGVGEVKALYYWDEHSLRVKKGSFKCVLVGDMFGNDEYAAMHLDADGKESRPVFMLSANPMIGPDEVPLLQRVKITLTERRQYMMNKVNLEIDPAIAAVQDQLKYFGST